MSVPSLISSMAAAFLIACAAASTVQREARVRKATSASGSQAAARGV